MQTLCLDKLQYILMQQMPAQLRDVFLSVGSHSGNIWFSDQKQPLKHLPWASFHHKLKYFIQKLERVGGLIIQSFAMSDIPQARASWARALSHKGRSLIHSLPSQTTSTPIFLPRHFSDNTGKRSWGEQHGEQSVSKHWGASVPANVTHWDRVPWKLQEPHGASSGLPNLPPSSNHPARKNSRTQWSLENLLLLFIPFSFGLFLKQSLFSPSNFLCKETRPASVVAAASTWKALRGPKVTQYTQSVTMWTLK